MTNYSRKKFLGATAGAAGLLLLPQVLLSQAGAAPKQQKAPPLDRELVKEFVSAGHNDLQKVKSMLNAEPDLLNASYDWSEWDWEDALGGAGHMGNREIALYLLENGARPTICVAAMLGNMEVVTSFIKAFPQMVNAVGPHNITLLDHARKGGKHAKHVVKYLESISQSKQKI